MSFASAKLRLASRRNLDKADVESVYGELVRVIGGTFFSSGVAVGPANGLLDWRNFSVDAGIPNQNKTNPFSVFAIQVDMPTITAGGGLLQDQTVLQFPWDYVNPPFTNANITGVTAACEAISNAVNTGTIQVNIANTSSSQNFTWTNAATTNAILANAAFTGSGVNPTALTPRDRVNVLCSTTGGNVTNLKVHVWIKILHSRG
jgi:hypothetical protein